ncbi:MAG: ion transporter, partial [Spirochaetia bacterium]|nr:ion transporter [Spirochaetia bacterium]
NPFIVIVSIVGLVLEFTPLKHWNAFYFFDIKFFNSIIDLVFLLDFIVRIIAFPKKEYFFKGYGWVDFLAAVPGILFLLEQIPGFMGIFKVLRIGRFFKIIRLLRFLKLFSFLRRMKSDSLYVQNRIMQIGVIVVLMGVVMIGFVEFFFERHFIRGMQDKVPVYQQLTGSFSQALQLLDPGAVRGWREGNEYYRDMQTLMNEKTYRYLGHQEDYLLVVFDATHSAVFYDISYINDRNRIVLTIIFAMIVIMLFYMLYMGAVFAKDMSVVTLINDSIDADDYLLLEDEGHKVQNPDGTFELNGHEDEIQALLKMINKLLHEKKILGADPLAMTSGEGLPSLDVGNDAGEEAGEMENAETAPSVDSEMPEELDLSDESEAEVAAASSEPSTASLAGIDAIRREIAKLREDVAALSENLSGQSRETAVQAVRISARSIVDYLKKNKISK